LIGIYFHIPFCKKACHYCDFHFSTNVPSLPKMIDALKTEWVERAEEINGHSIRSVYFGGGTPSLIPEALFISFIEFIKSNQIIAENVEFTVEVNPDDVTPSLLNCWKKMGVNRISLGVQSMDDGVLKWMNRAHDARQAALAVQLTKEAGIDNISVDLIYGHGKYTNGTLTEDILKILSLGPTHLSAYALTIEPKTVLDFEYKKNAYQPLEQEYVAEEFLAIHRTLTEVGMHHYELSNYAFPGKESLHNSSYWQGFPYLGFGPSSHSFDGYLTRSWNVSNNPMYLKKYLHKQEVSVRNFEKLSPQNRANEYWMTGLRTAHGVDLDFFEKKLSLPLNNHQRNQLNKWYNSGHLKYEGNRINCTPEGWMVMDAILTDLFF
jgi:oxygen-independent coproporphyrinogen III oxidase